MNPLESIKIRAYEKARDELLREAALTNYKAAIEEEDEKAYEAYIKEGHKLDEWVKANERHRKEMREFNWKPIIEVGKVIFPIAAYMVCSKAAIIFEETGVGRSAFYKAITGSRPKFL